MHVGRRVAAEAAPAHSPGFAGPQQRQQLDARSRSRRTAGDGCRQLGDPVEDAEVDPLAQCAVADRAPRTGSAGRRSTSDSRGSRRISTSGCAVRSAAATRSAIAGSRASVRTIATGRSHTSPLSACGGVEDPTVHGELRDDRGDLEAVVGESGSGIREREQPEVLRESRADAAPAASAAPDAPCRAARDRAARRGAFARTPERGRSSDRTPPRCRGSSRAYDPATSARPPSSCRSARPARAARAS